MASVCKELEVSENIPADIISRSVNLATVVFTSLYSSDNFENLDVLRYCLYARRETLETLPPSDDDPKQHVLRSLYQTRTWVQAAQPVPAILEPFKFGWKNDANGTAPLLTIRANVPDSLRTASFCKCKKGCTRNCLCKRKGFDCESACQCKRSAQTCARVQFQQDTELENVVAYINQFQQ